MNVTNNNQKFRPSEKDMKIIRQTVFEIIYFYVKENISIEETKSILLYLIDYNDDRQIANVLQVTFWVIQTILW